MAGFDQAKKARALGRMRKLPAPVKRRVRAQMQANAVELVAMQQRLVPVDDANLKNSIKHEDLSDPSRIAARVSAGGPATTREVRQGAGKPFDYARAVEFGREGQPARPFFFASYRVLRRRFKARLSRAAKAGIAEALNS